MTEALELSPGVVLQRLDGDADRAFAFEMKRAAMGPHIVSRWGWDEAFQWDLHCRRFAEKPFFAILRGAERVGTLSLLWAPDHLRFGEFYLLPALHGQGIGSTILAAALAQADARSLPVRLEYLKWNPVGSLYKRHGFRVTHESDIHYFMERAPAGG